MARLVFGMNQSLDGYVDHDRFAPDPVLFRYFIGQTAGLTGSLYGRRMYEIMRYWDDDDPSWDADFRAFAEAWRKQPKWVASRTLKSVGPNATLIEGDLETFARQLKRDYEGEIDVAGTKVAQSLADLMDGYRIYLHPVVLGGGTPFFAGPRPRLQLESCERIGEALRLIYVPA